MCVSLHLTQETFDGWFFSFGTFGVLMMIASLGILGLYVGITRKIIQSRGVLGQKEFRKRQMTITILAVSIVMTNLMCWFPVSILGKIFKIVIKMQQFLLIRFHVFE